MSLNSFSKILALSALGAALPLQAGIITASGPGALPGTAQDLTGLYPTEIVGTLPDTTDPILGVDMFKIRIDPAIAFSAITVGSAFGIPDTELFLFDAAGNAIYANDDLDGGNTLSCLPSNTAANPCPATRPVGIGPLAAGTYYLAITRSSNLPLSNGVPMFQISNFTDVAGPALTGSHPITGWDGGAFTTPNTDLVNYDIVLTATTPEPATGALFAAALLIVFARRRAQTLN